MAGALGKVGWKVLGYGFAIPAGIVVRKGISAAWTAAMGSDPPKNPEAPGTQWKEAIAWAAASGVAITVARMVAADGAARVYKTLTGHLPPGLEGSGP
ncbi:MAG: DUF4235 domain-containing protein [Geodermatophilaceae bacterium]|nr:DUF4235 domain-containing protein [Geodermatophilaceae bacterium]